MTAKSYEQIQAFKKFLKVKKEYNEIKESEKTDFKFQDDEKKIRINSMKEKYGEFICLFCKYYLFDKQDCAWKFSRLGQQTRKMKLLNERIIINNKITFCDLFKEK